MITGASGACRSPGVAGARARLGAFAPISTSVKEPVTNQLRIAPGAKGSRLVGAAATREALASSPDVLRRSGLIESKGLQQFYTPPEAADLVGRVLHAGSCNVVDLTAGDGSLISAWPRAQRYGIEIDADQIAAGDYTAIHGDLQHVFPLLRLTRPAFHAVALNPPFGLTWRDGAGKSINSTLLALRYGLGILHPLGRGVLLAGRDRFARDIAQQHEGRGVYAVIDCPDLFDNVGLQCVLAFFAAPHRRTNDLAPARIEVPRRELPGYARWVNEAHSARCGDVATPSRTVAAVDDSPTWRAVAHEHTARRQAADARQGAFDIALRSGRLRVALSPFASLTLRSAGALESVKRLHRQSDSYFSYNMRDWVRVRELAADGALTICPQLIARIESVIERARRAVIPNYPVRPQQRLGYLDDLDSIRCVVSDRDQGYLAGERYPLKVESQIKEANGTRVYQDKKGEGQVERWRTERKVLRITIGPHSFDEQPDDIAYIIEHFDVPDPGDLASAYPAEVESMRELLRSIARDYGMADVHGPLPEGRKRWSFKDFQIEDLARLLVKRDGELLSWEQGLGKTLGMMAVAVALERLGVQPAALFVVPQDLIPQWHAEAQAFFGRDFTLIKSPAHARSIAQDVGAGGGGWFIVHMEGLSRTGRRDHSLDLPAGAAKRADHKPSLIVHPSEYLRLDPKQRAKAFKNTKAPVGAGNLLTTEHACPVCLEPAGATGDHDPDDAPRWNGRTCRSCGHVHKRLRVHTAGHWLSTAFRRGAIFVDEITNAAGDSMRADAVCGLHSDHRYGGTGTPIRNYVNDSFKILWWCLRTGDRFPYDYADGRAKFERDFCVIEYASRAPGNSRRKVLPRVTNVSMLWRLLCGGMIRRRKEDSGERLVPLTLHPTWVPAGVAQAEMNRQWGRKFKHFFTKKNPGHALVAAGMVEKFEAALGLLWKMEYASTLPAADPDLDELRLLCTGEAAERLRGVSNWTPANLKAFEIALRHVRSGEKVVIFSDLIETGRWMTRQLCERGVLAEHLVEERQGKAATKSPAKRAKAMQEFRFGATQVLCVGIKAVKQGHNLDTASVAIFVGEEWSHEASAQAIARVHRLSSRKPVNIYIVGPRGPFMAKKKRELLTDKGGTSDLALDGQLVEQDKNEIAWAEAVKQLKSQGLTFAGDEIPEADIYTLWQRAEGPFAPVQPPKSTVTTAPPEPPAQHRPPAGQSLRLLAPTPERRSGPIEDLTPVREETDGQFALVV